MYNRALTDHTSCLFHNLLKFKKTKFSTFVVYGGKKSLHQVWLVHTRFLCLHTSVIKQWLGQAMKEV